MKDYDLTVNNIRVPKKTPCGSSTVQNIISNDDGRVHAGIAVHVCQLPEGHDDKCQCWCGKEWRKF